MDKTRVGTGASSSPRYVTSSLSRKGFSIPIARRLASNSANSRSRAFGVGRTTHKKHYTVGKIKHSHRNSNPSATASKDDNLPFTHDSPSAPWYMVPKAPHNYVAYLVYDTGMRSTTVVVPHDRKASITINSSQVTNHKNCYYC